MVDSVRWVIGLNCLLAGLVMWLACLLWRWRGHLVKFNVRLASLSLSQRQVGYAAVVQRAQLAETRLEVAKWQMRSQRLQQLLRLIKLLRRLALYRAMQRRRKLSIK